MDYELICKSVLAFFIVLGGWALVRGRPDWLLWQLLLALTMGGFNWYVGTILLPGKVIMVFGILYLILHPVRCADAIQSAGRPLFWVCIGCLVVSTLVGILIEPPDVLVESTGLQTRALRPFVQLYSYIAAFAAFPLALISFRSKERVIRFCGWYIGLAVAASLVAVFQLALTAMGGQFMPILRWNSEHSEVAAFNIAGHAVNRVYAFAGEPKHLAVFLMPALFMLLVSLSTRSDSQKPWWSRWWILALLGTAFIFTFSSAALIALAAGLFFLGYLVRLRGTQAIASMAGIVVAMFLVVSFVGFLTEKKSSGSSWESAPGIVQLIHERTVARLVESGDQLIETEALKYFVNGSLVAMGFGLGPGMYVFHLNKVWESGVGVDSIDSGWVAMLMDIGLIGTGVVLTLLYGIWRSNLAVLRTSSGLTIGEHSLYSACLSSFIAAVFLNMGIPALVYVCLMAGVLEAARISFSPPQPRTRAAKRSNGVTRRNRQSRIRGSRRFTHVVGQVEDSTSENSA
jgi:hypothetical protein